MKYICSINRRLILDNSIVCDNVACFLYTVSSSTYVNIITSNHNPHFMSKYRQAFCTPRSWNRRYKNK